MRLTFYSRGYDRHLQRLGDPDDDLGEGPPLCGDRDAVTPPELSKEIANGIPGATFALVKDAGHVSNADNPSAFNALLDAFLRR